MRKSLCILVVLAAAVSTLAVAKDVKQNKQAVSATQMTNSEMDKVVAGTQGGVIFGHGYGHFNVQDTTHGGGNTVTQLSNPGQGPRP
jgi:opacity protein-like surface antigen